MSAVFTDPILEPWSYEPDEASAFGPIVSAFDVEHALARCVRRWQRDYLGEVARRRGLDAVQFPPYASIVVASDDDARRPEDQTPTLIIASPGLQAGGRPRGIQAHGGGELDGRLEVHMTSHITARGNRTAGQLARLYAAAVRAMIEQQAGEPPEGIVLRRVEWAGERYGPPPGRPAEADRTLGTSVVQFVVEVADMVRWQTGPLEPTMQPTEPDDVPEPREFPEVKTTEVTIEKEG
jgi:hypothetical protein